MKPLLIQQGLWVGGIGALAEAPALGITHVVSVVNAPDTLGHPHLPPQSQHHLVDVEDSSDANLLQQLPAALEFMQRALQGGGIVLVHCAAGVSRSPAVVMAYLMKCQEGLAPAQALALVRQSHPAAFPNAGFMRQLELYHAMGCALAEGHVPYKRFLLERAGRAYEETGTLDAETLAQPFDSGDGRATLYRCRKCRALVATANNVVEVEQGPGASAFPWRKRDKQQRQFAGGGGGSGGGTPHSSPAPAQEQRQPQAGASEEGGSLFTEPLRWMAGMVVGGPVQGKLYCPKCTARLGSFNWSGSQSSSGAWVVPAFQLHTARLDAVDPGPPAALAALRQPRIMLSPSAAAAPAAGGIAVAPQQAAPATAKAAEPSSAGRLDGGDGGSCPGGQGCSASAAALAQQLQQQAVLASPPEENAGTSQAGGLGAAGLQPLLVADAGHGSQRGVSSTAAAPARFFSHLILDCDGVMVDSERASCEALRQSILQVTGFDIPHSFPEDYQPVFGMDVENCIRYYQDRFRRSDWGDPAVLAAEVSAVKEGIYKRLTDGGIPAFAGVVELIRAASGLGLGVAVASSGSPEKIQHNMSSSGLWGMVDEHLVVSAKYVAKGKPAPDVYLEALRRLGCRDASRALVVEDAVNGLKAARAAGCFSVGITNSLPRHVLEPFADAVVGAISEVEALLQRSR